MVSIFHNFIKVEDTQATHLCALKPFIEDSVMRFAEFFFKKADTFAIKDQQLRVLLAVSDKCCKFIISQVKMCLEKNQFLSMIPEAAEEFVAQVHLLSPAEVETSITTWINKHVLLKRKDPLETSKTSILLDQMLFGSVLTRFGVTKIEVELAVQQEKSLTSQLFIFMAMARNCWSLSENLLLQTLIFFGLCLENPSDQIAKLAAKGIGYFFFRHRFVSIGSTSQIRFQESISKDNSIPSEFKWVIPEKVNPARTKTIVDNIFFQTISACEANMKALAQDKPILCTADSHTELFYHQALQDSSKEVQALVNSPSFKKLEANLRILIECLTSNFIQMIQLRSSKIRGVLETFKQRLTHFTALTGLYASPRYRDIYLGIFHASNQMAVNISSANKNTGQLWKLPKSTLLTLENCNFNYLEKLATTTLADYWPLHNFTHHSKWQNFEDCIASHSELVIYDLSPFPNVEDKTLWVFSPELCDYMFNKLITTFFRMSLLFIRHFESKEMFADIKELVTGSWMTYSTNDLAQFLLITALNVLSQEHHHEEHFNKTAVCVEIALEICANDYLIDEEQIVFILLQIGRQIVSKGTHSLMFPIYYRLIKKILGWTIYPPNIAPETATKLIDAISLPQNEPKSVIDTLEISTRLMVYHRTWTPEFRAKLVAFILKQISTSDLNRRHIFLALISFLDRKLRKTDFKFNGVLISPDLFTNNNGYVDVYMIKEAFRQIRYNIGYSDMEATMFTDEQLKELSQIDQDCVPSIVFPMYLSLPFQALRVQVSEDSTINYFAANLATVDNITTYVDSITSFLCSLIGEYTEGAPELQVEAPKLDEESYLVNLDFAELLIDTKKKLDLGRDIQLFSTLKIFCMFLKLEVVQKILAKMMEKCSESTSLSSKAAKVTLAFYCALLGAAGYYPEEDFMKVLELGKPVLKPFFTSINSKFLEGFIVNLNKSLRGNLSYKRLNLFFKMIREMMLQDHRQNWVYYLNIFIFQFNICQMVLSDELITTVKEIIESTHIDDILTANSVSRMFKAIYGVRILISYNMNFIKRSKKVVSDDTIGTAIYDRELVDFDTLALGYLDTLKKTKAMIKFEGMKPFYQMNFEKKLTSSQLPLLKKALKILCNFSPEDDFADQSFIPVYRKLVSEIRDNTVIQRTLRQSVQSMLYEFWDGARSLECLRAILKIFRVSFTSQITERIHRFIKKLVVDRRFPISDEVYVFLRDELFAGLSDQALYAYADKVQEELTPLVHKLYVLTHTGLGYMRSPAKNTLL